jgi:tRNA/tmRNA/rRNA uracil-C5-methylase (TrmA/RlmC/RlmD family)
MTSALQPVPPAEAALVPDDHEPVLLTLQVGPVVHGGHCVAHYQGRVVFVRHAIPGETVVAQLTEAGPVAGLYWADTVEVLQSSERRRVHPWKLADPLRAYQLGRRPVAGAEYGHIVLEHQRRLKAQVVRDALGRAAHHPLEDIQVHLTGLAADEPAGMHWRTRNAFSVSSAGRLSMPAHRSPDIVAVRNIPLAVPALDELALWELDFTGAARVEVTTPGHGRQALVSIVPTPQVTDSFERLPAQVNRWRHQLAGLPDHVSVLVAVPPTERGRRLEVIDLRGDTWVQDQVVSEQFGTRTFRVSGGRFRHVHRDGPATLVGAVMAAAQAQPGQVVADLYAGAGLFSAFLAEAVGDRGLVFSVEVDPTASRDARHNLHDVPHAVALTDTPARAAAGWLNAPHTARTHGGLEGRSVDTVVLSPPHAGAGPVAVDRIHQLNPDRIVYVSRNPVSLARDTRYFHQHGWHLDTVEVYDLYPNTHHLVSVSVFISH